MAPDEVQELLAAMPAFEENQYYYAKNQQILVFKVMLADIPDSMLFLFFAHVGTEDISRIGSIVESSQLALKWYLRGHKEFARRLHEQRTAFFEGVFIKHNIGVEDLLREQGIVIHRDSKYAVMLMDMGQDQPLIPPADFRAKLLQFRQRHQTELIIPIWAIWSARTAIGCTINPMPSALTATTSSSCRSCRQIGIRKPERQSKIHFSQKYERATLFACLFFSR